MRIGKIARASGHIDYVCQVYQPGEVERLPGPADYAFGEFVRIECGEGRSVVGLVYDTVLMNPDFGALGPRLSPPQDLAVFSPDYLNEKVTLAGIVAIGSLGPGGAIAHGVPPQAVQVDAPVEHMAEPEVAAFHADGHGGVRLGYAPLLVAHGSPLARHLLLTVIERLERLYPTAAAPLAVLKANVAWRAAIEPLA